MGISDLFGFGNKDKSAGSGAKSKVPFRTPREVTALRAKIDAENRENFPSMATYKDIELGARAVYRILDAMIELKDHADDALRTRDELARKLEALHAKIKANVNDSKDYVEKNIDYLERKSTRNHAKTLFTEFLTAYELFLSTCREGSSDRGAALDSATTAIVTALSALNSRFIKIYKQDREIQGLRDNAIDKITELGQYCAANAAGLESKGLKTRAEANMKKLQKAVDSLFGGMR